VESFQSLEISSDEEFQGTNFGEYQEMHANFTSDEETNEYQQIPSEYSEIPSEGEEENPILSENTESNQRISRNVELSPETIRKNKEAMEEFDKKYKEEMIAVNNEVSSQDFQMTTIQVEEIKEVMKSIKIANVPQWIQIPEDQWQQLIPKPKTKE